MVTTGNPIPNRPLAHTGAKARRRRPKARLQPPLTPMIDVTFQLLIFFLLTMTFRQAEGQILGCLPRIGGIVAGQAVQLEPVFIVVTPADAGRERCIYKMTGVQDPMDTPSALYEALVGRRGQIEADEPVIICPQANVPWRFVVEAFNQAVRAEYAKVGFAVAR